MTGNLIEIQLLVDFIFIESVPGRLLHTTHQLIIMHFMKRIRCLDAETTQKHAVCGPAQTLIIPE